VGPESSSSNTVASTADHSDQPGKNPLKYSAVAGNWTRATGRTASELSHWAIMTDWLTDNGITNRYNLYRNRYNHIIFPLCQRTNNSNIACILFAELSSFSMRLITSPMKLYSIDDAMTQWDYPRSDPCTADWLPIYTFISMVTVIYT